MTYNPTLAEASPVSTETKACKIQVVFIYRAVEDGASTSIQTMFETEIGHACHGELNFKTTQSVAMQSFNSPRNFFL